MNTPIREDFRLAPIAIQHGWEVILDPRDEEAGRTDYTVSGGLVPCHTLGFRRGNVRLWRTLRSWRVARLDPESGFVDHRDVDDPRAELAS
jgi:hypothetical protein